MADDAKINEFLNPAKVEPIIIQEKQTVYKYVQELIDDLKCNNKIGNHWVYESTRKALLSFHPDQKLYFEDLDFRFLNYLIKKELKPNSIYLYLRTLRAFYNRAVKIKLVDRVHCPFHDFKLRSERTRKRAVDVKVLKQIIDLKLPEDQTISHARNFFLLSFCLIGISIVDLALLKPSNVINDRVFYRRRKTGKLYDIKLVPH